MSDICPLPENVRVTVLEREGGMPEFMLTAGDGTTPTFIYLRLSALDASLLSLHLAQRVSEHDASRQISRAVYDAYNPRTKETPE